MARRNQDDLNTGYRIVRLKVLDLDEASRARLDETQRQYATAFNMVSDFVWSRWKSWSKGSLSERDVHDRTYKKARKTTALPSQLVITARSKAIEATKALRTTIKKYEARKERAAEDGKRLSRERRFSQPKTRNPSIRYDARRYSINLDKQTAAFAAVGGKRVTISFHVHDQAKAVLASSVVGSAELVFRGKQVYLHVSVLETLEAMPKKTGNVKAVDRGVNKPAVASDGKFYGSRRWRDVESKYLSLKSRLQAKGTRSARRHLKRLERKLGRFRKDCDHTLAKRLVESCEPGDTLVFEDLDGIRDRIAFSHKETRRRFFAWSFSRLFGLTEFKARRKLVYVATVDPRDTSRRCPACGHVDKKNRRDQAHFVCVSCGFSRNADLVAAWNIRDRYKGLWAPTPRARGQVNGPNVAAVGGKPRTLVRGG